MIIKLDMANAFDGARHSFLLKVLKRMGLDETFIRWIGVCISSPWITPLVNGRVVGFFKASRGLRQGCPLSPFLYITMEDTLSRRLEKDRDSHLLPSIRYKEGTKSINHGQFAYDTIFLGGSSVVITRRFKGNLDRFLRASG